MAETNPTTLVAPTTINGISTQHHSQPQLASDQLASTSIPQQTATSTTATDPTSNTGTQPKQTSSSHSYPVFSFPKELPTPPFIDVSGIPNFRCLGGYLSANGTAVLRPSFLYRCAHPTQITSEGLTQITTDLGIKAIYDLRSSPEVARTTAGVQEAALAASQTQSSLTDPPTIPSQTPLFQSLRHFTPVYTTEDYGPEALARKLAWYSSPSQPTTLPYPYSEGFVNAYRDIAIHGAPAYTTLFQHILTRPNDPLIFHCTAGKDRTGVFAALICRLAGIDDSTTVWEYALTEPGLGDWRRLFITRMTASRVPPSAADMKNAATGNWADAGMTTDEAKRVCGSRAGNLRAWLTLVLDAEFGGVDRYLTQYCGFTELEVEQIKRNLVVDVKTLGEYGEERIVRPCEVVGWTPEGGCVD